MPTPDTTELAVWRYGLISRLLHRHDGEATLTLISSCLPPRNFTGRNWEGCASLSRPSGNGSSLPPLRPAPLGDMEKKNNISFQPCLC